MIDWPSGLAVWSNEFADGGLKTAWPVQRSVRTEEILSVESCLEICGSDFVLLTEVGGEEVPVVVLESDGAGLDSVVVLESDGAGLDPVVVLESDGAGLDSGTGEPSLFKLDGSC